MLCVGARDPFKRLGARIELIDLEGLKSGMKPPRFAKPTVWLLPAPTTSPKKTLLPGYQSGWSIQTATRLVLREIAHAIVTGPISKERLQAGGYPYPGHTEFLADLCGKRQVTMMLANDQLRITLATTHLSLKEVPTALTRPALRKTIEDTIEHLRSWWGIPKPKIAVAALNPHAGEAGLFGREEIQVIRPVIEAIAKKEGAKSLLAGPLPADTLFAKHVSTPKRRRFDAVVCMYHDQGLIPVKLLDFPRTVNVTLGLPIIRTSVDHGVGFDIAGKGIADPSSLESAIRLAADLVRKKRGALRGNRK